MTKRFCSQLRSVATGTHLERPRLTRRGDIVVVASQGDSGKTRPAVIVQADWFDALPTVMVLPLTSVLWMPP
jgi:hypothetical protein